MHEPARHLVTLRWLHRHFTAARAGLGLALLLACVTALSGMALLGLAGWFIGASALAGLAAGGAAFTFNLFSPSAGIRGFALSRTVFRYLERLVSHDTTFKVMQHLRTSTFGLVIRRIPGSLSSISQGHLLERLLNDMERLESAWLEQAQPALLALFVSTGLGLFLCLTGQLASLLMLTLFFLLLISLLAWRNRTILSPLIQQSQQQQALRSELVQALTGLPEVRAYGIGQQLIRRWQQRFACLANREYQLLLKQTVNAACIQAAVQLAALCTLLLAIAPVTDSQLSGPIVLATVLLIFAAAEVYQPLARTAQRWQETRATVARMQDIENSPLPAPACRGHQIPQRLDQLQMDNVTVCWPGKARLFQPISLTVTPQTPLAIVGASGAGKSTLLHCIMGLQAVTDGRITLGDTLQTEADETAWRQQFSLLLQQQHLFTGSLRDNLRMARPQASDTGLWRALELARLAPLVAQRGGLDMLIGPQGLHLSGGQARRLALAKVLLQDAPVVLLDEPFTGLEQITADALLEDIKTALADRILIMVTHNRAHSARFAQCLHLVAAADKTTNAG